MPITQREIFNELREVLSLTDPFDREQTTVAATKMCRSAAVRSLAPPDPTNAQLADALRRFIANAVDDHYDDETPLFSASAFDRLFQLGIYEQNIDTGYKTDRIDAIKSKSWKAGTLPTGNPAIESATVWELTQTLHSLIVGTDGSDPRSVFFNTVRELTQNHYGFTAERFQEIASLVYDSRAVYDARVEVKLDLHPETGHVIFREDYVLVTELEHYNVIVSTDRRGERAWYRRSDVDELYFISDAKIFEGLRECDPRDLLRLTYKGDEGEESPTGWRDIPIERDRDLEAKLASVTLRDDDGNALDSIVQDDVIVLAAQIPANLRGKHRFRQSVRLPYPVTDRLVRWQADYPVWLESVKIDLTKLVEAGFKTDVSWFMGGEPTTASQQSGETTTVSREVSRWVTRHHGFAVMWLPPANANRRQAPAKKRKTATA